MSLSNSALLIGGTVSATGGVSKSFIEDGQKVNNGIHLVETAPTDFRLADSIVVKTKQAAYNATTGEWSKSVRSQKLVRPVLLASGKIVFRSFLIEVEDHPEVSVADSDLLRTDGCQLGFDSDFVDFWRLGTLA